MYLGIWGGVILSYTTWLLLKQWLAHVLFDFCIMQFYDKHCGFFQYGKFSSNFTCEIWWWWWNQGWVGLSGALKWNISHVKMLISFVKFRICTYKISFPYIHSHVWIIYENKFHMWNYYLIRGIGTLHMRKGIFTSDIICGVFVRVPRIFQFPSV
jgi:hypothetical protein